MGASSVTGKGLGPSEKLTTKELSKLAVGPQIMAAGIVHTEVIDGLSPETFGATVLLNIPLPGGETSYSITLTPKNAQQAYISDVDEDADGNVFSFDVVSSEECDVCYLVVKVGQKSSIL